MSTVSSPLFLKENVIIDSAKSGDENALNTLLSNYEPYIKSIASSFNCYGIDIEDLIQEGRIGLVSAVKLFRCDAGASFKTYVCLCIKRQIVSAIRNAANGKNKPMSTYVSLDDIIKNESMCEFSNGPEEIAINRERIKDVKSALSGMFTNQERQIFLMYINGYSYKSIAQSVNTDVKQVDNSLQRIKRKLSIVFS